MQPGRGQGDQGNTPRQEWSGVVAGRGPKCNRSTLSAGQAALDKTNQEGDSIGGEAGMVRGGSRPAAWQVGR